MEMGDAALGLACAELADAPHWAALRNMPDPTINGDLPAEAYPLNEQTTCAIGYYTADGKWTSTLGHWPHGDSSPATLTRTGLLYGPCSPMRSSH